VNSQLESDLISCGFGHNLDISMGLCCRVTKIETFERTLPCVSHRRLFQSKKRILRDFADAFYFHGEQPKIVRVLPKAFLKFR